MTQLELSDEAFRHLLALKNHWSLHHRRITNPEISRLIEEFKLRVFGYNSSTPAEEMERIAKSKSKAQLQQEAERFAKGLGELARSGKDFEPEYTLEQHIKKMIEVINENDIAPLF